MSYISSDPLSRAITRLLEDIDVFVDMGGQDVRPDILDKYARAITSQLKALQEVEAHNTAQRQNDESRTYTAYEDFPAPTPEERERFKQRLEYLISKVETRKKTPNDARLAREKC